MDTAPAGLQTPDPIEVACRALATETDPDEFFRKSPVLRTITGAEVEFSNLYVFVGTTRHLVTAEDGAKEIIKNVLRRAGILNDKPVIAL